jgi:hypothetical protein
VKVEGEIDMSAIGYSASRFSVVLILSRDCRGEYEKSDTSLDVILVRPRMKVHALCQGVFFFGKLCTLLLRLRK